MTQRTNLRDDKAAEGLPTADDYEPDALGTVEYRAGEPEQSWPEYGIELAPIEMRSMTQDDWHDTGRRHVIRNGKYLADVSDEYQLLPNEHLVGVSNQVARDMGAGPFHEFDGDWFVTLDDHVFQDADRRRVHANYAWQQGEIGGDDLEYGFAVHNSIDASLGFSVSLFSFRHACANMVYIGTGGSMERMALGVEEEREVLQSDTHRHTKGLDVDAEALAARIKGTLTLVDDIDATYEQWLHQEVTAEEVRDLLQAGQIATKDLPGWMRDIPDVVEEVAVDEYPDEDETMPWERQAEVIEAEIPSAETVWQTYMTRDDALTANIWKRGASSDTTRRSKMKATHRVFNPGEHGKSGVELR